MNEGRREEAMRRFRYQTRPHIRWERWEIEPDSPVGEGRANGDGPDRGLCGRVRGCAGTGRRSGRGERREALWATYVAVAVAVGAAGLYLTVWLLVEGVRR